MKRIISFLLAAFVFIFNCIPIFAAEFVSGNFNTIPDNFLEDINLTISEGYKYVYYFQAKNNSWDGPDHHIIYFDFPLDVEGSVADSIIILTNSENSDSVVYWSRSLSALDGQFYSGKTMALGESFTIGLRLVIPPELLIYNGDCVSKNYCSEDVFVEMGSGDDYEEDGVVIKGLTSFFNKMTSGLNEIKETVLNIPKTIIQGIYDLFVPDIENMKTAFNDFIDYMTAKFGFNDLIETLQGLVDSVGDEGSTVGAADVKETFSYNIVNSNLNFEFKIPFSDFYNSIVKNEVGGYMKGIFFLLLIFYNLSELYFLIRGVRPWKDPQITMIHNEIERDDINSYIAHRKGGGYGV